MRQTSFADSAYVIKKKVTRKERFLTEMDSVLPWSLMLKPIETKYSTGSRGQPPGSVEALLRIYFMQQWCPLSDPAMEDGLYDIESMRRFAKVDLESIPGETRICRFRYYLEARTLTKKLFRVTEQYLSERGLILSEDTIVHVSIISAPTSTKNEKRERAPEMKQTKKGNQWHFGMKMHICADTEGRVNSVIVADASVHNSVVMDDLLHGDESEVYGDKPYANDEKREQAQEEDIDWRLNRKACRGRQLNCADESYNRKSNRTRVKVEHAIGVLKNLWGDSKVRFKGLHKNVCQAFKLFALANVYMAWRELVVWAPVCLQFGKKDRLQKKQPITRQDLP